MPPNAKHVGALTGYEMTYTVAANKITFSKMFYLDYLLMQPSEFDAWNESVKKVSEAYRESIILKKK
jgi:hypothetical protein